MGLFMGDVVVKTAIELGLDDIRQNDWIIEEIFSDFICNPFLREKYGMKEIERAKEWIKNNKIHIFMAHRLDTELFPCVTIAMGDSDEDNGMTSLADQSPMTLSLNPDEADIEVQWVVNPFNIETFDSSNKEVYTDVNLINVREGMKLIQSNNGQEVARVVSVTSNGFIIDQNIALGKYGIAPRFNTYKARMERIISNESYSIGCHAHGDPSALLFLYAFVKYTLLRYREGMFEGCGFQNSTIKCTDMIKNTHFQQENIYSRFIALTGQAQESWAKELLPHIEATNFTQKNGDAGIKILSNHNTIEDTEEDENGIWITIEE